MLDNSNSLLDTIKINNFGQRTKERPFGYWATHQIFTLSVLYYKKDRESIISHLKICNFIKKIYKKNKRIGKKH